MVKKRLLFLTFRVPEKIIVGSDSMFFHLLKAFSQLFEITIATATLVSETWASQTAHRYGIPEPLVIAGGINLGRRTLARRGRNWLLNRWYEYFGSFSYDESLNQKSLMALLQKIDIKEYSVVFAFYLYYPKIMRYLVSNKGNAPVVLDSPDVQFERYAAIFRQRSPLNAWSRGYHLLRFRHAELAACRLADVLVVASKHDEAVFRKHLPEVPMYYCPTSTDTEKFYPASWRAESGRITFLGALNGEANIDAAQYFAKEIFPKVLQEAPHAVYVIVGSNPPDFLRSLQSERVIVTGYIEDLPAELQRAECFVCPFRLAYGNRGRIYEAMAVGLPCVVTSAAVRGMGLEQVTGIIVRDDPQQFADAVVSILTNPALRQELSQKARQWCEENASFDATYGALARYLSTSAGKHV